MVVFISPAGDAQPVRLVLDEAPDNIVQRAQRIDFEIRERIAVRRAAPVLEPQTDSVHRLHEHPLFVPVRPDQFEETRGFEPVPKQVEAIREALLLPFRIDAHERIDYPFEVGKRRRPVLNRREVCRQPILDLVESDLFTDPSFFAGDDVSTAPDRYASSRISRPCYGDAGLEEQESLGGQFEQIVGVNPVDARYPQQVPASIFYRRAADVFGGNGGLFVGDRLPLIKVRVKVIKFAKDTVDESVVRVESDRIRAISNRRPERMVASQRGVSPPQRDPCVHHREGRSREDRRGLAHRLRKLFIGSRCTWFYFLVCHIDSSENAPRRRRIYSSRDRYVTNKFVTTWRVFIVSGCRSLRHESFLENPWERRHPCLLASASRLFPERRRHG